MGGSGGGGYGPPQTPDDLARQVHDAEEELRDKTFEAQLAKELEELLKAFNDRDTELVRERLEKLLDSVGGELEGSLESLFGGSIAKHTYVDGLSDVDALLLVDQTDLAGGTPAAALNHLRQLVDRAVGSEAEVTAGELAVTIKYPDGMEIQLLPAMRSGDHVRIPARGDQRWSEIDPRGFQRALTDVNKACNGKVVPAIKLAKAINDRFPEAQKLSGYHIESMGIEAFKGYAGGRSLPQMLAHFYIKASGLVKSPIRDKTGQSVHVDDYLGGEDSHERRIRSHVLGRVAKRMANASASQSLPQWMRLFGE